MNFDASLITYARKPKVGKLEVTKSNWLYIDVEKLVKAFPNLILIEITHKVNKIIESK